MIAAFDISVQKGTSSIIRNFSTEISDGQIAAFVGPSGSGKTTILRTICGLEPKAHGRLIVQQVPISLPKNLFSKELTALRLNFCVFFGPDGLRPYEKIGTRLKRLAAQCEEGLPGRFGSMVSMLGLGNVLDRYPSELSMGQKSRAGLLSAFAMGRSIVILDEFGSNLDQQNQEILFAFVREFGKGKTIILATHSEALAHANCDILIPVPENGEF